MIFMRGDIFFASMFRIYPGRVSDICLDEQPGQVGAGHHEAFQVQVGGCIVMVQEGGIGRQHLLPVIKVEDDGDAVQRSESNAQIMGSGFQNGAAKPGALGLQFCQIP